MKRKYQQFAENCLVEFEQYSNSVQALAQEHVDFIKICHNHDDQPSKETDELSQDLLNDLFEGVELFPSEACDSSITSTSFDEFIQSTTFWQDITVLQSTAINQQLIKQTQPQLLLEEFPMDSTTMETNVLIQNIKLQFTSNARNTVNRHHRRLPISDDYQQQQLQQLHYNQQLAQQLLPPLSKLTIKTMNPLLPRTSNNTSTYQSNLFLANNSSEGGSSNATSSSNHTSESASTGNASIASTFSSSNLAGHVIYSPSYYNNTNSRHRSRDNSNDFTSPTTTTTTISDETPSKKDIHGNDTNKRKRRNKKNASCSSLSSISQQQQAQMQEQEDQQMMQEESYRVLDSLLTPCYP